MPNYNMSKEFLNKIDTMVNYRDPFKGKQTKYN